MHSFSLIFLKFLNLWSVCVPFICCLCIQCIYIYVYIYTSQNSGTYSFKKNSDLMNLMPAYWGAHVFFCGNFPKRFDHWHFSPKLFDPKKDTPKIPRGVRKIVAILRFLPIVLTFIAGYGIIVLEEVFEIHKTATALILGVMVCLGFAGISQRWSVDRVDGCGPWFLGNVFRC